MCLMLVLRCWEHSLSLESKEGHSKHALELYTTQHLNWSQVPKREDGEGQARRKRGSGWPGLARKGEKRNSKGQRFFLLCGDSRIWFGYYFVTTRDVSKALL